MERVGISQMTRSTGLMVIMGSHYDWTIGKGRAGSHVLMAFDEESGEYWDAE